MDVCGICKSYFSGFKELASKGSDARTRSLGAFKVFTYVTLLLPLIFGIVYGISESLANRQVTPISEGGEIAVVREKVLHRAKVVRPLVNNTSTPHLTRKEIGFLIKEVHGAHANLDKAAAYKSDGKPEEGERQLKEVALECQKLEKKARDAYKDLPPRIKDKIEENKKLQLPGDRIAFQVGNLLRSLSFAYFDLAWMSEGETRKGYLKKGEEIFKKAFPLSDPSTEWDRIEFLERDDRPSSWWKS